MKKHDIPDTVKGFAVSRRRLYETDYYTYCLDGSTITLGDLHSGSESICKRLVEHTMVMQPQNGFGNGVWFMAVFRDTETDLLYGAARAVFSFDLIPIDVFKPGEKSKFPLRK